MYKCSLYITEGVGEENGDEECTGSPFASLEEKCEDGDGGEGDVIPTARLQW